MNPKTQNGDREFRATWRTPPHAALLILAFVVCVGFTTGAGLVTPDMKRSGLENRRLQQAPRLPREHLDMRAFVNQLERYASDQSGFRETIIHWQRLLQFQLFGTIQSNTCFLGKDRWLFVDGVGGKTGVISGRDRLTAEQTASWVRFFGEQADWLSARGTRFVVSFVPNKYAVYPEHLPRALEYDPSGITYLGIAKGLEGHPNTLLVDLLPPLLAAKDWSRLYSPADTHWNGRGAYVGYREIVEALQPWYPETAPLGLEKFVLTEEVIDWDDIRRPVANLARQSGIPQMFSHRWLGVELKNPTAVQADALEYDEDPGFENVVTPLAFERPGATGPRAVYIGDSFRWPIIPFLAEHFGRILFLDIRNTLFDRDAIERENPDLVIFSVHSYYYLHHRDPYRRQEEQEYARANEQAGAGESILEVEKF